jgi:hypothetical protein
MVQRPNWKVLGILAAMTSAGVLILSWPSWAQQNFDRAPTSGQPAAKKEQAPDTQPDLKRTAEELAKLKQYLDMLKADYDAKVAQLKDAQKAQQKPGTIEQRLSEIERKLDMIIATLGKKGPTAFGPTMAPPNPYTTPVPPVGPVPPAHAPVAPPQPRQPAQEQSGFTPVFPVQEPRSR